MDEEISKGKTYFTWDRKRDKVLGTCLVDQLNLGNKLDGRSAWKPAAWSAATSALYKHCGKFVTKKNIQSRLKTWEKHYEILSPLLSKSGGPFTWDYTRNRILVHEESVWEDQLKANPKIAPYHDKIEIENWDDICVIFSQDRANGEGAKTASEAESTNPEVEPDDADIEIVGDSRIPDVSANVRGSQQTNSTSSTSRGKKRKASDTQLLCNAVSQMAESLTNYFTMGSVGPRRANADEVLAELNKVPGLDRQQILKGFDLLRADIVKFESFCALPIEMKGDWLLMHLQ